MTNSYSRLLFDLYSDKSPRSSIRKIKWESCKILLKLDVLAHGEDSSIDQIGLFDSDGDGELSLSEFYAPQTKILEGGTKGEIRTFD